MEQFKAHAQVQSEALFMAGSLHSLERVEPESDMEQFKAHAQVQSEALCMAGSFAMKCAVELDIPNILHAHGDSPMSLVELAKKIPIPPQNTDMLRRIMRTLTNRGIFAQPEENMYALTMASRLLLFNDSSGASAFVRCHLDRSLNKHWYYLSESLRSNEGKSAFQLANEGKNVWDTIKDRPEISALFFEGLSKATVEVMEKAVSQYPQVFRGVVSLVDVGGGTGSASIIISKAFPEISCTVLDLPQTIVSVPSNEKVKTIAGDMFHYIPPSHAVFLRNVFHNWSDENCVKILKKCKEAISSVINGKIIIMDIVINSHKDDPKITELQIMFDLLMMSGQNGKEREEQEWKKIFSEAGFSNYKIYPLMDICSIIELYP